MTTATTIPEREFDLIAELIRSRDPARAAARLVLVNGYTYDQAAKESGCKYTSVTNTVYRIMEKHHRIVAVFRQ